MSSVGDSINTANLDSTHARNAVCADCNKLKPFRKFRKAEVRNYENNRANYRPCCIDCKYKRSNSAQELTCVDCHQSKILRKFSLEEIAHFYKGGEHKDNYPCCKECEERAYACVECKHELKRMYFPPFETRMANSPTNEQRQFYPSCNDCVIPCGLCEQWGGRSYFGTHEYLIGLYFRDRKPNIKAVCAGVSVDSRFPTCVCNIDAFAEFIAQREIQTECKYRDLITRCTGEQIAAPEPIHNSEEISDHRRFSAMEQQEEQQLEEQVQEQVRQQVQEQDVHMESTSSVEGTPPSYEDCQRWIALLKNALAESDIEVERDT